MQKLFFARVTCVQLFVTSTLFRSFNFLALFQYVLISHLCLFETACISTFKVCWEMISSFTYPKWFHEKIVLRLSNFLGMLDVPFLCFTIRLLFCQLILHNFVK